MTILITGAAGNLGSILARHLVPGGRELRLMYHRRPLATDLASAGNVRPVRADLADSETLKPAVSGVDVIVHFAGRLFAAAETRLWLDAVRQPRDVDEIALNGVIGSIAHLAYHLGAIRQINQSTRGPREGSQ